MSDPTPAPGTLDHLYLIDGSGYIFRAYHALPPLSRSDGTPTGAVHGFCQMLWKLLEDTRQGDRPSHFAVIFDASGKTFRNDIYPEYKAHRPPPPEDLVPQFTLIREAVRAFDLPCVELEGFEADDLIAAYARRAEEQGARVTIVSSDKDLMQLVSAHVSMFDTMKNRRIARPEVEAYFGVGPERVVDVQALAGDASDNVPGVPGIGIKTAALLINEYGDLDTLLARADEIRQPKRRQNLIEFADQARLSRELVRLDVNAPLPEPIGNFQVHEPDAETLLEFLERMEFTRLTKRIAEELGAQIPAAQDHPDEPRYSPSRLAAARAIEARESRIKRDDYVILRKADELQYWLHEAREQGHVAVDTETTSLDAMQADLVGISLALGPGRACYLPLGHKPEGLDLGGDDFDQMPLDEALGLLRPLLEDPGILKIGQN
ncbi:MAG TPA: DNA polymerase I, partial [Rhizobiales bacterium]|nr:DNA polymerase I [Hyphomicrobiales bacterium]